MTYPYQRSQSDGVIKTDKLANITTRLSSRLDAAPDKFMAAVTAKITSHHPAGKTVILAWARRLALW